MPKVLITLCGGRGCGVDLCLAWLGGINYFSSSGLGHSKTCRGLFLAVRIVKVVGVVVRSNCE